MVKPNMRIALGWLTIGLLWSPLAGAAYDCRPCAITRVSVASDGSEANDRSRDSSFSADGRYVAFHSVASNLDPPDTNGVFDIFVHDRVTGRTERVSISSAGGEANDYSNSPSLSGDGRYVAFMSKAENLVPNDANQKRDIFVHDRETGATRRISVAADGSEANGHSYEPRLSADGRYVAYRSWASNLTSTPDTNGQTDVFIHDRDADGDGVYDEPGATLTARASLAADGSEVNGHSDGPGISADGRYVAFSTYADNLTPPDANNSSDVFVHNRTTGGIVRVSVASDGSEANGHSYYPSLSADGRFVAFHSYATNLGSIPTGGVQSVFVHDRDADIDGVYDEPGAIATTLVSLASSGAAPNYSSLYPSLSADGRYVAYYSSATNIVVGDSNNQADVFVHDRQTGQTRRVSVASDCSQYVYVPGNPGGGSAAPVISPAGSHVALSMRTPMLVPFDTNRGQDTGLDAGEDVFVADLSRDRDADGFPDASDNCPKISNITQADADADGIGDACAVIGILDLGTLGGPESSALGINERGQIVGWSDTSSGRRHAFLWSAFDGMQDLGTLGGASSAAHDINDHGQVAGHAETASGERRPFVWRPSQMTDLGTLGGTYGAARGINNMGAAAGTSATASGMRHAFMWSATDGMRDLGVSAGGSWSAAADINVYAQVAADGDFSAAGYLWTHGFVWHAGVIEEFGFIDAGLPYNHAHAINGCGQVVGNSVANGDNSAYLVNPVDANADGQGESWYRDADGDGGNDLALIFGAMGENEAAYGINDLGEIVGVAWGTGDPHGFLRTRTGALIDLGTLGGPSTAYDVNRWREAVGDSTTATPARHAVLFKVGPSLPAPPGAGVLQRFKPIAAASPVRAVSLEYGQVSAAGTTRFSTAVAGPQPPVGFKPGQPPAYFHLATSANFTGALAVCADYAAQGFGNEARIALFHYEDTNGDGAADAWVDRTVSRDAGADRVCASVGTLSKFALFEAESGPICPFAAAMRGTAVDQDLRYVRAFRDRHLLTSTPGRRFVELYYRHGPALAQALEQNESLRTAVRWALIPVVQMTKILVGPPEDEKPAPMP